MFSVQGGLFAFQFNGAIFTAGTVNNIHRQGKRQLSEANHFISMTLTIVGLSYRFKMKTKLE